MIGSESPLGGVSNFSDEVISEMWNFGKPAISLNIGDPKRRRISYKEAEYEHALRRLHGQYLQLSEEDWKELKRISNKYGY